MIDKSATEFLPLAAVARRIARHALPWTPSALAAILLALIFVKAIMAVDLVWDSLAYHLLFSALRVGLMSPLQFKFGPANKDLLAGYYLGFPILADLLRGWMWKISGRPEAVNLLAGISLLGLIGYLKWTFRQLEVAWVLIGILAVPAIQDAAAGDYVDLPANAMFTVFLLSVLDLWNDPKGFNRVPRWLVLFLSAFAAANIKTQTAVFVCLALPFVIPPALSLLRARQAGRKATAGAALLGICASAIICSNFIKNLILYRNPLFPLDIKIGPIHLVGIFLHDAWNTRGTTYAAVPQSLLWLMSVWPAAGSADTELGVLMEPEVCHGETEVYTRVQA